MNTCIRPHEEAKAVEVASHRQNDLRRRNGSVGGRGGPSAGLSPSAALDKPKRGRAVLPRVPERCLHNMLCHVIEVFCIVKQRRRVPAIAFQHDLLQVSVGRMVLNSARLPWN